MSLVQKRWTSELCVTIKQNQMLRSDLIHQYRPLSRHPIPYKILFSSSQVLFYQTLPSFLAISSGQSKSKLQPFSLSTASIMPERLGAIGIGVADMARSVAFYKDQLGMVPRQFFVCNPLPQIPSTHITPIGHQLGHSLIHRNSNDLPTQQRSRSPNPPNGIQKHPSTKESIGKIGISH